jgi:hypothetical protein
MTTMTPDSAAETLCPFARTFARTFGITPAQKGCHGPSCALWRWQPITTDHPAFVAAYETLKANMPNAAHATRMKNIMDNRAAYGIPTKPERGFCGAGGQP